MTMTEIRLSSRADPSRALLAGTGVLLRLALRRDRVVAGFWTLGLVVFPLSQAGPMFGLYPTQADLDRFAATYSSNANPAVVAFTGPGHALDTYGGATAWQVITTQAVLLGLMSYLLVIRHTRAEEESGRSDLLDAAPVGRLARLTAALLHVGVLNLVVAGLTVLSMLALGLPLAGSVAMATGCAGVGLVFAAVGAVTAQFTEAARPANGMAGALLGLAFLLRAAGDSSAAIDGSAGWLSWLSPIGWAEKMYPYDSNRWWLLLLPAATVVLLLIVLIALRGHRDSGAGLRQPRPGPASASAQLRGPFSMAWRLHRGSIIGWSAGMAVAGLSFGGLAQDMIKVAEKDPQTAKALAEYTGTTGNLADLYLAAIFSMIGVVAAGFAVQAALRLRSEETGLRAEPLLAGAVSRVRWAGSHAFWAAVGSVVVLASAGLSAGLAHGLRTGQPGTQIARMLGASLGQLPAVWLLAGVAIALFGLAPRASAVSWAVLLITVLISQLGPLLRLDQWVMDLSPFTHLPKLPSVEFTATPFALLTTVALALVAAGLVGFAHRDVG